MLNNLFDLNRTKLNSKRQNYLLLQPLFLNFNYAIVHKVYNGLKKKIEVIFKC